MTKQKRLTKGKTHVFRKMFVRVFSLEQLMFQKVYYERDGPKSMFERSSTDLYITFILREN
jgi:hypothetical protein